MCATLTHGPIVGATTHNSAVIWVRADRCCKLEVKCSSRPGMQSTRSSNSVCLTEGTDFTGTVKLENLRSNTRYYYRVYLNDSPCRGMPGEGAERAQAPFFSTFPQGRSPRVTLDGFSLAFGSCFCGYDAMRKSKRDEIFLLLDRIRRRQGDLGLFLMIGDNIYADLYPNEPPTGLGWPNPPTKLDRTPNADLGDLYREVYRDSWAGRHFRRALARIPTFMTMDDHELINDFGKKHGRRSDLRIRDAALDAYRLYQDSHNPGYEDRLGEREEGDGDRTYDYTIDYGGVPFYVLDTRTGRCPKPAKGDDWPSMLGPAQRKRLIDWLKEKHHDGCPVKLIVSSVPLLHMQLRWVARKWFRDQWQGWQEERKWLLKQISDHDITGVCFLSGDVHMNHAVVLNHSQKTDLSVYCCTSSGLSMTNPSLQDWFQSRLLKLWAGDDVGLEEYELAQHRAPAVSAVHNFGVLHVRPEAENDRVRIGFEIYYVPQEGSSVNKRFISDRIEQDYRWICYGFPDHWVPWRRDHVNLHERKRVHLRRRQRRLPDRARRTKFWRSFFPSE